MSKLLIALVVLLVGAGAAFYAGMYSQFLVYGNPLSFAFTYVNDAPAYVAAGQVTANDGSTISILLADGTTQTIVVDATTVVSQRMSVSKSIADLPVGTIVSAIGASAGGRPVVIEIQQPVQ